MVIMAPLTFPSGCVRCAHLADKIVEDALRHYQIQEAEKVMDAIIFRPPYTDTTCAQVTDADAPCPAEAVPAPVCDATGTHSADAPPVTVSDDPWT